MNLLITNQFEVPLYQLLLKSIHLLNLMRCTHTSIFPLIIQSSFRCHHSSISSQQIFLYGVVFSPIESPTLAIPSLFPLLTLVSDRNRMDEWMWGWRGKAMQGDIHLVPVRDDERVRVNERIRQIYPREGEYSHEGAITSAVFSESSLNREQIHRDIETGYDHFSSFWLISSNSSFSHSSLESFGCWNAIHAWCESGNGEGEEWIQPRDLRTTSRPPPSLLPFCICTSFNVQVTPNRSISSPFLRGKEGGGGAHNWFLRGDSGWLMRIAWTLAHLFLPLLEITQETNKKATLQAQIPFPARQSEGISVENSMGEGRLEEVFRCWLTLRNVRSKWKLCSRMDYVFERYRREEQIRRKEIWIKERPSLHRQNWRECTTPVNILIPSSKHDRELSDVMTNAPILSMSGVLVSAKTNYSVSRMRILTMEGGVRIRDQSSSVSLTNYSWAIVGRYMINTRYLLSYEVIPSFSFRWKDNFPSSSFKSD